MDGRPTKSGKDRDVSMNQALCAALAPLRSDVGGQGRYGPRVGLAVTLGVSRPIHSTPSVSGVMTHGNAQP
jgi:hypothetical protein